MPNPKVISPPAISVALEMPTNAEFALSGLTTSDPWAKAEHPIAARRNKKEAILRFDLLIRFLPFWMPLHSDCDIAIGPRRPVIKAPLPAASIHHEDRAMQHLRAAGALVAHNGPNRTVENCPFQTSHGASC